MITYGKARHWRVAGTHAPSPPAPLPRGERGAEARQARPGFTLVEMLVATALVMFIMLILSEAFVAGLEAFRTLKGIGDMEERLRAAAILLRADLQADHFDAGNRIGNPAFWTGPKPTQGFFRISQGNTPTFSTTLVAGGGQATVSVPSGQYAVIQGIPSIIGQDWVIQRGSWVLVDQGPFQELVQVAPNVDVSPGPPPNFTASFNLPHLVINPLTGMPVNPTTGLPYYLIRPLEGIDADGIPSARATEHILHMAVKLPGTRQENFFTAHLPWNSPFFPTLLTPNPTPPPLFIPPSYPNPFYAPTTTPDQAVDGRFQDLVPSTPLAGYKTPWAEVAYFLWPNGATAGGTTLYALYRCEFKVVPDNSFINGTGYTPMLPGTLYTGWAADGYEEMSCQWKYNSTPGITNNFYYFNSPGDLATPAGTLGTAVAAPGVQTVTATPPAGVTWTIQAGSAVIVDSGLQTEMVTVLGPPAAAAPSFAVATGVWTFAANFSLPFASPHAVGATVQLVNRAFAWPQSPFVNSTLFPATLPSLRGAFVPGPTNTWSATLVATDVVSFDVQILPTMPATVPGFTNDFSDVVPVAGWPYGTYDTALPSTVAAGSIGGPYPIKAVRIILRVWNAKTLQTRQVTIIQQM